MKCPYCGAEVTGVKCEYCDSDLSFYEEPKPEATVENNTSRPFININIGSQNNYAETRGVSSGIEGEAVSPKSKTACAVLCFMGIFRIAGLHRFYAGKIGSGILYLFTFGLFFVGTFVDLILILTGNFKDSKGRKIK